MAERIPRVPVREQDPKVRARNFEEVCYGYNLEEAMKEASRCLHCKNPRCVTACPVSIKIPEFIAKVKEGDIKGAAAVIAEDSSLPAVCGRVCPQETQCEGSCILGIKGESVAIGKLERFVADHSFTDDPSVDNVTAAEVEIQVHLAPGVSSDKTIDALYAFTDCEISLSPNCCVIENNKPCFLTVSDVLRHSVDRTMALLRKELEIRRGDRLRRYSLRSASTRTKALRRRRISIRLWLTSTSDWSLSSQNLYAR